MTTVLPTPESQDLQNPSVHPQTLPSCWKSQALQTSSRCNLGVRLLVLYTAAAAQEPNINTLINQLVAETNDGYYNNMIRNYYVNPAYAQQVSFQETLEIFNST
jgi:hypothetical protein